MLLSANLLATGSNGNRGNAGSAPGGFGTWSADCLSVGFGCLRNNVGGSHHAVGAWWARQDCSKAGVGGIASSSRSMSRNCLKYKGIP